MGTPGTDPLVAAVTRGTCPNRPKLVATAVALLSVLLVTSAQAVVRSDTDEARMANEIASGHPHQNRTFWTQIAGARYGETSVVDPEATPLGADLFAVRMRNARDGLIGGAACNKDTPPEATGTCPRVPVIYGMSGNEPWHEVYRSDQPGYVGAIAWIGRGQALAVGGTGKYPRREANPPAADWDFDRRRQNDIEEGAGDARAWYFHDGSWEEITNELPPEMTGLSAVDVWIGREPGGDEWGLAGDYGHIWEWRGGRFTGKRIDRASPSAGDPQWSVLNGPTSYTKVSAATNVWQPSAEESHASLFQYRVREIRIAPDRTQKRIVAFTGGCCGPSDAGGSRRIEYVPQPKKNEAGVDPTQNPPPREQRPRWIVSSIDTYGESVYSFGLKPSRYINSFDEPDQFGEPQPKGGTMTWSAGATVVASAAPKSEGSDASPLPVEAPGASNDRRYVDSDGDTESVSSGFGQPLTGDGVPDWQVGAQGQAGR
ncbi:MAG: hypothetical protein QOG26_563, partial [Solirubrobacterales bacterium]|nr:hypothetical protein [Solirubrobacterales bacterium]